MKKFALLLSIFLIHQFAFSQRGKDGTVTIAGSATVNVYTSLTTDASAGAVSLNVQNATGFTTGDLVYIIQMQGASVNCYSNIWGNPNSPEPYSSAFGKITNYNNAGNNEYVQVASVAGNIITIDCGLKNNYTAAGKVQVIKVPRYASLTVNGTITCPPWNGTIGGVIALEVLGNTTINASGRIEASATGFRGGAVVPRFTGIFGGGAWGHNNQQEGAYKGESIAGDTALYNVLFNGQYCKGAVANGGGGGNANNAGGGGGANGGDTALYVGTGNPDISVAGYITAWNLEAAGMSTTTSSGGGRGGYSYSNANLSPLTNGPGTAWGTNDDDRRNQGGMGGRPLNYNSGRIFLGGGGGAGEQYEPSSSPGAGGYGGRGGHGGGIINLVCYGNITGTGMIISNGENGANSNTTGAAPFNDCNGKDAAGGGGGGGAIYINCPGTITTITLSAKGGNGGNQQMKSGFTAFAPTAMAYGPGGGGGGGYIGTTAAALTTSVNGGVNGIVQYLSGNENCQIDNLFPPNGATKGGSGTSTATLIPVKTITATPGVTLCANSSATLLAGTTSTGTINWYTQAGGGTLLGSGSPFTTSVLTTPGVYTVYAGTCADIPFRAPVTITVNTTPTVTAASQTICTGQTTTLTASGASTYLWNTGATTSTISVTPAATTVYTVTGANGGCSSSVTSTVIVNPGGTITVNSATICSGQSATLTAGAATSYTWNTGANTVSISVTPAASTVYTINATSGTCVLTNTASVTVNTNPTVTVGSFTLCSGQSTVITASGASSYTWNTGANTASISAGPSSTTIYTVTGSNGNCNDAKTSTITVNTTPTVSVNSATICSGNSATLTASGATTYTWNTGANTASISVNPSSTTVYTISGTSANCIDAKTATVTVNTTPTVSVNSATICSGNSATLTASGASTYTWNTGANTASISVNPSSTTVYTITGGNGNCTNAKTSTVTVNTTPTVSVNSTTICSGNSATLTASGATTYTWNTGANTASISVSPSSTTVYTVSGTSANCIDAKTATITVNTTPTVSVNSATICSGNSATLTASGASTYTWNTGANTASISVNPSSTTVYTITGGNGNCTNAKTSTVTVNTTPTVSVNSATICSGSSATLTANGASSYSWNTGATNSSIVLTPTITTTYTVTGTNANCSASAVSTIIVNAGGTITVNSATICSGETATLTAGAAGSYTWNTGSNSSSITVNPVSSAIYTINATTSGCVLTNTAAVTVNTTPTVAVINATLCSGQNTVITASGASTYSWNTGATTNTISVSPVSNTVYTVTGTTGNCSNIKTTTVTVNPNPTVTVNSPTICSGSTATLTASGASTYSWNTGGAGTSINANPLATTVYTVTGTTSGCNNIQTATVTVVNIPTVSVNSSSLCSGNSIVITASGASSYSWNTGATTASVSVNPSTTTIYTVTGFNGSCASAETSTIDVISAPTLSLNSSTFIICGSQTATIIAGSSAGTYTWNTGVNTNSISTSVAGVYTVSSANTCSTSMQTATVIVSSGPPSFTIVPSSTIICNGQNVTLGTTGSTGSFTWNTGATTSTISVNTATTIIASLSNGCGTASDTLDLIAGATPSVNVTASSPTLCTGGTVTLSASSSGTYAWSSTTATTSAITVTNTGIFTVTVTNECGSDTSSFNVINGPAPLINITPSGSFCNGQTVTLTASGATSYSWTNGTPGPVLTTTVDGTFTAAGTNSCGTSTTTYNVVFSPPPSVTVSASQTTVCPNATTTLTANGLNGGNTYNWADFPSNTSSVQTVSSGGTYLVTYSNTCGSSTAAITVVQSTLTPGFNFSPSNGTMPLTVSFTNTSVNNSNNQWSFGNGQTSANVNESGITYNSAGIYTVTLIIQNTDGCTATISQTLEVLPTDFGPVPEIITPNGDLKNDAFIINGIERYPNNELFIYNRWGNLVYKMKGYNNTNAWDGHSNAENKTGTDKLPVGTYFILLNLNDGAGQVFRGYCQLMY